MPKTPTNRILATGQSVRPKRKTRRRTFVIIAAVCAVTAVVTAAAISGIRSMFTPTLENSKRLLARGRPGDAMALLDKMKKTSRESGSRELLHRGKILYSMMLEQMREERWGSYGVDPDNWLAHPLAEEAERNFLEAMAISPKDSEIRLVLGNLYREQGRFADAEEMIRSSLEIDEDNAEAFLALGLLYAEGGRFPAAERALFYAWELDEGNPRISKNIGFFYRFYMNVPESSIVWLGRYLDADPRRDLDINLVRAEMRVLLERYPEFAGLRGGAAALPGNRGAGRSFVSKRQN